MLTFVPIEDLDQSLRWAFYGCQGFKVTSEGKLIKTLIRLCGGTYWFDVHCTHMQSCTLFWVKLTMRVSFLFLKDSKKLAGKGTIYWLLREKILSSGFPSRSCSKIVSEYDQEIPQSQTAGICTATQTSPNIAICLKQF